MGTPAPPPADLERGSFSDNPPWLVDPDEMTWRRALPGLRRQLDEDLPKLIKPSKVPPGQRVFRTTALIASALVLWAVGARRKGGDTSIGDLARRLRLAAERLGPTYIKLGQILSSGEGIFPAPLVDEFKKCRDQVPPEPFSVVRDVVEGDLGRPLEDVFSRFDTTPLAAASIAQVHLATLHTGEEVVVKVQRPSVGTLVHRDLRVMAWVAPFLVGRIPVSALANPPALVEVFANTITEELDFRIEAENMLDVARSFADLGQRDYVIPRPHPTLVTRRVLVMERLSGFKFDDVVGMKDAGVDTEKVVRTGMIGFMEGAMIHGIFHGDLHGGNLMVLPDGRTALLDFGIVGRLSETRRLAFLRLLMTATSNDIRGQLEALRDLGAMPADTDLDDVIKVLNLDRPPVDPTTLTAEEITSEIQNTVKALLGIGASLPKELMLFVKNMVFLDGAIATLAPDLDLVEEIGQVSLHFATAHGERLASQMGLDMSAFTVDVGAMREGLGMDANASTTYREMKERRELIAGRLQKAKKR
jgi:ubiquinone biosynthesis protein